MKTSPKILAFLVIAGFLLAMIPTTWALAGEREDALSAAQNSQAQLAEAATNPDLYIGFILDDWATSENEEDLNAALQDATPVQLVDLLSADSFVAVQAILQGRSAPVSVDGLDIQDLGSLTDDLTFTPRNPPCRVLDTRQIGGVVSGGSIKNYWVHGSSATMNAQGGNSAGCPAPKGEPVGVALNLAAVNPLSNSHLRVWPYGFSIPTVSYLNYTTGVNLANAGIISTAYLQGYDISIYNGSPTHYLADVMGYFYPASQPVQVFHSGYDLGPNCLVGTCTPFGATASYFEGINGSTTVTLDGTQDVLWTFSANVYSNAVGQYGGTVWPAWHQTNITYPNGIFSMNTFQCQNDFNFSQWGSTPYSDASHSVQSSCKLSNIPAGTYTFGAQANNVNSYGSSGNFYFNSPKFTVTVVDKP